MFTDSAPSGKLSPDPPRNTKDIEASFFETDDYDGRPLPADHVDAGFDEIELSVNYAQPLLILLVAAFAVFLAAEYYQRFLYFFTPSELIEIGDVEALRGDSEWSDGGVIDLPTNRYVSLAGVSERLTSSGDTVVFKLLGTHIYVETEQERLQALAAPDAMTWGEFTDSGSARYYHDGPGRLVRFDKLPRSYTPILRYYSDTYGVRYCGVKASEPVNTMYRSREERARLAFFDEHGREATDAELREEIGPSCETAWLMHADKAPKSSLVFVIIYGIIASILLFSGWLLLRWGRRYALSRGS